MTTHKRQSLWRVALALVAAFGVATPAYAFDAYWHGVRSSNWNHGASGGVSNWYTQPPAQGLAIGVPDEAAIFSDGAARFGLFIGKPTEIGTMVFDAEEDTYQIRVNDNFSVLTSPGVRVDSGAKVPVFIVSSIMTFRGRTNPDRADYRIRPSGTLELTQTRGNGNNRKLDARKVTNNGRLLLGKNRLQVSGIYEQDAGAFFKVEIGNDSHGLLVAPGIAISGTLIVRGTPGLDPGVYPIIESPTRAGQFTNVVFQNFHSSVTPTIRYISSNGQVAVRVTAN